MVCVYVCVCEWCVSVCGVCVYVWCVSVCVWVCMWCVCVWCVCIYIYITCMYARVSRNRRIQLVQDMLLSFAFGSNKTL